MADINVGTKFHDNTIAWEDPPLVREVGRITAYYRGVGYWYLDDKKVPPSEWVVIALHPDSSDCFFLVPALHVDYAQRMREYFPFPVGDHCLILGRGVWRSADELDTDKIVGNLDAAQCKKAAHTLGRSLRGK